MTSFEYSFNYLHIGTVFLLIIFLIFQVSFGKPEKGSMVVEVGCGEKVDKFKEI